MGWPSAVSSDGPDNECGMMLKEEPVLMRNRTPEASKDMWANAPGRTAPTTPWPTSFPAKSRGCGSSVRSHQNSSGRSRGQLLAEPDPAVEAGHPSSYWTAGAASVPTTGVLVRTRRTAATPAPGRETSRPGRCWRRQPWGFGPHDL